MRFVCWITAATHTHTCTICSTYCFATATVVTRTRLYLTFICTLRVLLYYTCKLFPSTTKGKFKVLISTFQLGYTRTPSAYNFIPYACSSISFSSRNPKKSLKLAKNLYLSPQQVKCKMKYQHLFIFYVHVKNETTYLSNVLLLFCAF